MSELLIIKIGGQVIDDPVTLQRFAQSLAAIDMPVIVVHGGGKVATRMSEQLGIETKMIEGRRVTDASTLEVVVQVYAGTINKQLVAQLQAQGKKAIGLTGADGDLVRAKKRVHPKMDYGFVGDITNVNAGGLDELLQSGYLPVMAPITHDGAGQLFNTNADTLAQSIAVALSGFYQTTLVFGFEKAGVLRNRHDERSVINRISRTEYEALRANGVVSDGMIPKLDNAFTALSGGVTKVIIGKADQLTDLLNGKSGTTLLHE